MSGACAECVRRSWLLATLSGPLDCFARDRERLPALLALDDGELIKAVGGRRREELRAWHEAFDAQTPAPDQATARPAARPVRAGDVQALCRHDPRYPRALVDEPLAPRMLNVLGGAARLHVLCRVPAVAIVGSRRPSDYGREMARSLARGLTASGVCVVAGWHDGIAIAAHEGALEAGGGSVAVLGGGVDVASPARYRALLGTLARSGCAIAELPDDCAGRRWGQLASERTVVALAAAAIVVEAEQTAGDLAATRIAAALGRAVAAVPGRVTSPLSQGTNDLLAGGARLVRDAGDVLELVYEIDRARAVSSPEQATDEGHSRAADSTPDGRSELEQTTPAPPQPCPPIERRLLDLLDRVGAGSDTPERLVREDVELSDVLAGLSELELLGLLSRGDGGRYTPSQPLQVTFHTSTTRRTI